ncbi:MAG: hypothetical protein ACFFD4_38675 [Candidatus Odinarchaeota archaeon]
MWTPVFPALVVVLEVHVLSFFTADRVVVRWKESFKCQRILVNNTNDNLIALKSFGREWSTRSSAGRQLPSKTLFVGIIQR